MQNARFILPLVLNLGPSLHMTPTGKKNQDIAKFVRPQ